MLRGYHKVKGDIFAICSLEQELVEKIAETLKIRTDNVDGKFGLFL